MIRFESVGKRYPSRDHSALSDVSFEILKGEFVFLVGASGSGKSTLLNLVLKETRSTTGEIFVLGKNLARISNRAIPYFRRNIGVVFQDFRLLTNKNVFENVAFALRVTGGSRAVVHHQVPETLKLVGLDGKEKSLPTALSGGEQQRVAIARAIVSKPQILLADEPTGNLDPATSAGIMTLLERINRGGTTVVMATHERGIVDQMQRRVIELENGKVVRDEQHAQYVSGRLPIVRGSAGIGAVASPKVDAETMQNRKPLYVEREVGDAVTAAAARISDIATGKIPLVAQAEPPTIGDDRGFKADADGADAGTSSDVATRLGIQTDGNQGFSRPGKEVGPTK